MVFVFDISFAANKDEMSVITGTRRVVVESHSEVDARLLAEQMVAATGVEPVQVEEQ